MRLYLSGGGVNGDSLLLDKKFASAVGKKPVLFIPYASDETKRPYSEVPGWAKELFIPLGISKLVSYSEEELQKLSDNELSKFGGVYISGGNTFRLLKILRNSGFDKRLDALVSTNIPIYGGSAGAIIFAKSIIPALSADENDVRLKDLHAFNKIKGYDVWCHYDKSMNADVREYIKKYRLKIIAIPEKAGLYLDGKHAEVVGFEPVYLYKSKIVAIQPGDNVF